MKTFADYIKKAIKELNLPSEYALAKLLNIKQPSLINMRNGKGRPSEETMLKIATLAKIDHKEALIDLAIWRAEDKGYPEVKKVWKSVSKMLSTMCVVIFLSSILMPPALARETENKTCTKLGIQISNNYKLCDKTR